MAVATTVGILLLMSGLLHPILIDLLDTNTFNRFCAVEFLLGILILAFAAGAYFT